MSLLAFQTRPTVALRENSPGADGGAQRRVHSPACPEFLEHQIEVHYTGELVTVYNVFVGVLEEMGKVYLQTVLDCYSRHAWGKLYTRKLPVTSVHVLNETVLQFFEVHETRISTILM